jgi:glycosyltransferase involved in cell wall biosynthesis
MKALNVLLVTYSFPPVGGVGVLRAASLARYLPAEGIRLDVLTARNPSAVGSDPTLLNEIPAEVTIHRTLTLDLPFGVKKAIKKLITSGKATAIQASQKASPGKPNFLKRAFQDLLLPDPQVTWLPVLTRVARRIVKARSIDLVLITVPPFSSMLLVEKLRKDFPQLPIVLDLRDEWITTGSKLSGFSRSEKARAVARKTEATAVANSTAVVTVTEAARLEIRSRYPLEQESKFKLVPNGFDATRLPRSVLPPPRADGKIVVSYIGSVYESTEPTTLAEAVQSLPPEVKSRFTLRFIGYIEEPRYREALLQLGNMVELIGFLPQSEALAAMNQTDYVLLVTHDPLNVSAKFYDYIGAGKPILATVHPHGEVRDMIENLRVGWWAASRDAEGIRRLFLEAAARGNSPIAEFHPDNGKISQYERKVIAQRYAHLLRSIANQAIANENGTQAAEAGPAQAPGARP